MSSQPEIENKPSGPLAGKLLQSGIIFSAINFLTLLIHWVFQFIVSPQLGGTSGEYGLVLATITFIGFLGLPLAIATQAITHYIARFHYSGDDARLHGLLAGCRKFLFHITIAGSVVAIVLVKPLGDFFNFPRTSLALVALICVLAGLWGSYVRHSAKGSAGSKTRSHRTVGGGSEGCIWLADNQNMASRRMCRRRIWRDAAG